MLSWKMSDGFEYDDKNTKSSSSKIQLFRASLSVFFLSLAVSAMQLSPQWLREVAFTSLMVNITGAVEQLPHYWTLMVVVVPYSGSFGGNCCGCGVNPCVWCVCICACVF